MINENNIEELTKALKKKCCEAYPNCEGCRFLRRTELNPWTASKHCTLDFSVIK